MQVPEPLARAGCFRAHLCCSGRAVLDVGPVSIRLERAAFDELIDFLQLCRRRLVLRDEHGSHWREIARTPDLETEDGPDGR